MENNEKIENLKSMSVDIVKAGGSLVLGYGAAQVAKAGVDMIIDNSDLIDKPIVAAIGKEAVAMCAGYAVGHVWKDKVDGIINIYKIAKETAEKIKAENTGSKPAGETIEGAAA